MPATLRISDNRLITAVRCAGGSGKDRKNWIDLYQSNDGGNSWTYLDRPVPDTGRGGNPPTLTALFDGRICITYAHRDSPYRICARLSEDQGKTWSKENVLRDDGGSHDIGYPRTVQRADGNLVTVYYFNERLGGPAYIAATVWNPSELSV
jgi:Neuraminidase (sialidase)